MNKKSSINNDTDKYVDLATECPAVNTDNAGHTLIEKLTLKFQLHIPL